MPTQPPSKLFDPELAKAQVRPVIEIATPLLKEVLSYGMALFARCSYRPEGDDENLAILFIYRHFLEMVDGVSILVAESAPAPAALLLRAMLESLLAIDYLTQDRAQTRSRALAYLYQVEINRKRFYLSQDATTPQGKTFRDLVAGDRDSPKWESADPAELAVYIQEIDDLLSTPDYQKIAEEYKRTKKKVGRYPNWYSLNDGPRNIAQLAKLLNRGAAYALLYREWSERTHSADAIDRILTHDSSGPAARSLRDATELNATLDFAIGFALDAARCLIRYYRPAEEPALNK